MAAPDADDGSGLGLYVSRELCRAMGGDLVLEPPAADRGAAFSVHLPGESPSRADRPCDRPGPIDGPRIPIALS